MSNIFLNRKLDIFLEKNLNQSKNKVLNEFKKFAKKNIKLFKNAVIEEGKDNVLINFPKEIFIECWIDEDGSYVYHNLNGFEEMIEIGGK